MTNTNPPPTRTHTVRLREVLPSATLSSGTDLEISDIQESSGLCLPGQMFAVIPGYKTHGADFITEALARGATALLVEQLLPQVAVPQCVVPNVRAAYAQLCSALDGNPSHHLKVAGVTGTNGKTTVTWLIRAMLRQAGHHTGLLGTVEYDDGLQTDASSLTTPDSKSFTQWLARMVYQQTTHVAVELSSHALHQGRVAGTQLAAAVLTNITQDHFDYHQNLANYQTSKARIFELLAPAGVAILNRDDPGAWELRSRMDPLRPMIAFSLKESAEVSARILSESLAGTQFRLALPGASQLCETSLIGRHNIENCLAAAATCHAWGVSPDHIAAAIHEFRGAPGRLERISSGQRYEVFVDYAHTDDALRRCLQCLRSVTPGRVICVFGAGGDRDRSKRPLLGRASQLADLPIITSDNPRSEDPERIAADIVRGFQSVGSQPQLELDRRRAIQRAIGLAQPGDCVLIAGKGHEGEQIFRDQRLPFDDRREARQAIVESLSSTTPLRKGA